MSRVIEIGGGERAEERGRHAANQLLNAAMTYARLILRKYAELGPFGYSMNVEGAIARETLEIPRLPRDPKLLWKLLDEHMAKLARRGRVQGIAMGANVSLTEPSAEGYVDAVDIGIEHREGYAIQVTVPYRIYGGQLWGLLPRRIAVGKMVTRDGVSRFFAGN